MINCSVFTKHFSPFGFTIQSSLFNTCVFLYKEDYDIIFLILICRPNVVQNSMTNEFNSKTKLNDFLVFPGPEGTLSDICMTFAHLYTETLYQIILNQTER